MKYPNKGLSVNCELLIYNSPNFIFSMVKQNNLVIDLHCNHNLVKAKLGKQRHFISQYLVLL